MDQEKFGNLIKEIRKKNNLTQKQLADKYNVTYQAVSKWENGLNMPDIFLIKKISNDFEISIDDLLDGKHKKVKHKRLYIIIISILIIILLGIFVFKFYKNSDFEFKTLSSNCDNFNISGTIAYNDKKSSIYISNIKYCGGDDKTKYKEIECTLYESYNNTLKKISYCNYNEEENITLEDFLQTVTLSINDYQKTCKEYSQNSLFLSINATDESNKVITYKIPLLFNNECS